MKKSPKHSTPLHEVMRYLDEAGSDFVKDFAELRVIHALHLGVFSRRA